MHLSFLLLWPECATRSNLRAWEKGRTMRRIKMSSTIEEYLLVAGAMMMDFGSSALLQLTMLRGRSGCSGDVAELYVQTRGVRIRAQVAKTKLLRKNVFVHRTYCHSIAWLQSTPIISRI